MIDGCVIKQALAADWMVTKLDEGDVIVELKGRNVEHGFKQVYATARYWRDNQLGGRQFAALIVCVQYPRVSTTIQKAKQAFAREFKGPLHVVSRNCEYEFRNVLSFKGPHSGGI
jgi:hypothetical protein